jgi:hypothetical protein
MLTFAGPGDEAVTEKHGIPRGGATCVQTVGPVSIRVKGQGARRGRAGDEKAKIDGEGVRAMKRPRSTVPRR